MKICPVEAKLFHAERRTEGEMDRWIDGQTDMTKPIVAFHNFANANKNSRRFWVDETGSGCVKVM